MGKVITRVRACGLTRELVYDKDTGQSWRWSKSADAFVNNGVHASVAAAKREAEEDIGRGKRSRGDTRYRGG